MSAWGKNAVFGSVITGTSSGSRISISIWTGSYPSWLRNSRGRKKARGDIRGVPGGGKELRFGLFGFLPDDKPRAGGDEDEARPSQAVPSDIWRESEGGNEVSCHGKVAHGANRERSECRKAVLRIRKALLRRATEVTDLGEALLGRGKEVPDRHKAGRDLSKA